MRDHITRDISTCSVCQKQKKQHKKYRLLLEMEAEYKPWEWQSHWSLQSTNRKCGHKRPELRCVMMIDPATGWFKINQYDDKKSITVANIVKQE